MRRSAIAVLTCVVSMGAGAHPGNGIDVAPDGTVYFADVARQTIWRLDPSGSLEELVTDRWTHSLDLAPDGTLYYEREVVTNGVAPASFWRIRPDGTHERLIPPQSDRRQFAGGDFGVDHEGSVYYAHNVRGADDRWRTLIMRRTMGGEVEAFTGLGDGELYQDGDAGIATIRIVTGMDMGPDGALYFADRDHIRRVEIGGEHAGRISTIASGLIDQRPHNPPDRRSPPTTRNRLYGIKVDVDGSVLVAYQAGRRVMRVAPSGEVEVVHESEGRWSPIGVAPHEGDVYILEVGDGSIEDLRVLRCDPDGETEIVARLSR
ncbi:MAG: hypothetical protein ACF8GE_02075 [Phycisphaerales bacterium JB043]